MTASRSRCPRKGRRLIVDPGKYTYTPGAWKDFFESRAAHNVVVVDGLAYDARKATAFGSVRPRRTRSTPSTTNTGYAGVTNRRRVVWSRASDYLIVDDQSELDRHADVPPDVAPGPRRRRRRSRATGSDTHFTGGNLAVVQLVGRPAPADHHGPDEPDPGLGVRGRTRSSSRRRSLQASVPATSRPVPDAARPVLGRPAGDLRSGRQPDQHRLHRRRDDRHAHRAGHGQPRAARRSSSR